ncbi:hypothetical protein TWF696_008620 [Orbilia brochopaga]|uniref:Uncharacterized protein n=1 Tax=Orbilia brochopaga TaxID=3140254 RepID=A0AAV9UGF8_9PEZI
MPYKHEWQLIQKLPNNIPRFDANTDHKIRDRLRLEVEDVKEIKDTLDQIFDDDQLLSQVNFHDCSASTHRQWRQTVTEKLQNSLRKPILNRLDARDTLEVGYALFQLAKERKCRAKDRAEKLSFSTPRSSSRFNDDGILLSDGNLEVRFHPNVPRISGGSPSPNTSFRSDNHRDSSPMPKKKVVQQFEACASPSAASSTEIEDVLHVSDKRQDKRKHRAEKHRADKHHQRRLGGLNGCCIPFIGVSNTAILILLAVIVYLLFRHKIMEEITNGELFITA